VPGVALVTGCSSGIGRALALALATEGWSVYAGVRSRSVEGELAELGCTPLALDVCSEEECRVAVERIEAEHGQVDALLNNAGYGLHGALEETSLDDARTQFETNLFSVARLCQLVLPGMRRRGQGHILNMSSMGGRITFPGGAFYHASKHALEAMTDALRYEVAGFGIRVVLIEPGPVRSAFGQTGIASLGEDSGDPAYASLRESIRAGLTSTFAGPGSELSSTPEQVAAVCLRALADPKPAPRYVVGDMAEALIEQRQRDGDAAWDTFLETLYAKPGPDSEPSG
jgi:NAD(P)-dependent dehydrogenase (short-subunit alcohol dehydrogenase family)